MSGIECANRHSGLDSHLGLDEEYTYVICCNHELVGNVGAIVSFSDGAKGTLLCTSEDPERARAGADEACRRFGEQLKKRDVEGCVARDQIIESEGV